MADVTVRDLRDCGDEILDRVAAGEAITVIRGGHPIAELRPLPRRPVPDHLLLQRWQHLPAVDWAKLRADDIDELLDPSL